MQHFPQSKEDVLNEFGGRQFSEFKASLADLAVAKLPITMRCAVPSLIRLTSTAFCATVVSGLAIFVEQTMCHVRDIVGWLQNQTSQ